MLASQHPCGASKLKAKELAGGRGAAHDIRNQKKMIKCISP
jgi:hypothetical protein